MDHELNPDEHVDDAQARDALDPDVGAGTPDTAPHEDPAVSWLQRQPLLAMLIVLEAPIVASLIVSYAAAAPAIAQVVLTLLAPLAAALVAAARQVVTPAARPRLARDLPLTPPGD